MNPNASPRLRATLAFALGMPLIPGAVLSIDSGCIVDGTHVCCRSCKAAKSVSYTCVCRCFHLVSFECRCVADRMILLVTMVAEVVTRLNLINWLAGI